MKDDTLWKHYSLFIRLRDADENGMSQCFTCGRVHHYKEMNASHFISRRHMATKYDERNVNSCCVYCNKWLYGNLLVYQRNLDRKYGHGTAIKLEMQSKQTKKLSQFEIKALSDHYRVESKKLLDRLNKN
jgi:5-methylcytosine-specific restriction endonuclease McrA